MTTTPDVPTRLRPDWHGIWTRESGHALSYGTRVLVLLGMATLLTGALVFSLGSLCPLWIVLPDGRVIECR